MQKAAMALLLLAACNTEAPSSSLPEGPVDPATLAWRAWRLSGGSVGATELGEVLARTSSSVLLRVNEADDTSFTFDLLLESPGHICVLTAGEGSLDPTSGVGRWRSGTDASDRSFELVWRSEASEVRARSSGPALGADCLDDDACAGGVGADVRFEEVERVPELQLPLCDVRRSDHGDDDHPLIDVLADILADVTITIDVSGGKIIIDCSSIGQRGGAVSLVALSLAALVARQRRGARRRPAAP